MIYFIVLSAKINQYLCVQKYLFSDVYLFDDGEIISHFKRNFKGKKATDRDGYIQEIWFSSKRKLITTWRKAAKKNDILIDNETGKKYIN